MRYLKQEWEYKEKKRKIKNKEYEDELDRGVHAQMEIFVLQKCIQDLEQKNFSLLVECQRLLEASKLSDRLISKLENDNVQWQLAGFR